MMILLLARKNEFHHRHTVSPGSGYASEQLGGQMQDVIPHGAVRYQYSDDRAQLVYGETVDGKLVHIRA
ncbi:hypothetical protein [Mesorhizobium mediterraneum]|uniref:hypothetical protein n=1 Tax=Mesorhizobium mediterraneum TaxID=43617 RepID=UPI00177BC01D|nr:hypothetical protein [Mesorhizobium mediterraneum]